MKRIAFTGASGTGKSTLMQHIVDKYGLEPVMIGSRSVAKEMGFGNPYDVDKAGKRAEFQKRLFEAKSSFEAQTSNFVTDRTVFDNLTYTLLHDASSVSATDLDRYVAAMRRYTMIVYLPRDAFQDLANDPARRADHVYHVAYDVMIEGLLNRYQIPHTILRRRSIESRIEFVDKYVMEGAAP